LPYSLSRIIELNNQRLQHPRGREKEVDDMMMVMMIMIMMMVVIFVQRGEFSFTRSGRQPESLSEIVPRVRKLKGKA
jgi:hypothetical protein